MFSLDSSDPLLIAAVAVLAFIVLMWTGKVWARRQVTRVEVRDRHGVTRAGFVVFGTWWHPFSRKVRVEWD